MPYETIMVVEIGPAVGLETLAPVLARAIPDIVDAIRAELIRLAHAKLKTGVEDYVQGIQPPRYHMPAGGKLPTGQTVATVVLSGWLPNAIENGWPGGDMKPWLLAGRNARMSEGGIKYNTIPFRHGTPGTGGTNFAAMGSGYQKRFQLGADGSISEIGSLTSQEALRLGKKIYAAAKKLDPTTSNARSGTSWGGRLPEGTAGVQPLLPHHKTDLYAGMVRQEKTYKSATQSQYTTFRRVSDNSDPMAFIHPGIEAHNLFRDAADYASKAGAFLLEKALQGAAGANQP